VTDFDAAIYKELRRPFTAAAVRFKIQGTFEGGAICIAYIDARLVSGRLNHVYPGDWWPEKFEPHPKGGLICHLTVGGVTRTDYGISDYENAKGDFSDALKRAAVHFGVGESLYVLPQMILREGSDLKKNQRGKYTLTPQGNGTLRKRYEMWLESGGAEAFGDPLDHGDQVQEAESTEPGEVLADLIAQADFNPGQVDLVREWAKNGNGLDPVKVRKATNLLLADEAEVLLERASA